MVEIVPPTPLTRGKTAEAEFAVSLRFGKTLRGRGATGGADVLAPLPAPQDELRRSDEYEESFEEEN